MPSRAPSRAARLLIVLAASFALAGLLAGCGDVSWAPPPTPVAGDGDMQVATREVTDFTRVSVSAPVKVTIGTAETASVSIEGQANVLPLIATEVVDGQLVVSMTAPGFTTSDADYPRVTIKAPSITSIALAGGCTAMLESTVADLRLDISGESAVTAIGTAPTLTLSMAQTSHAELSELIVTDAVVKMSDGSAATMTVSGTVSGTANGGSTLTLTAAPASQTVEVAGGGSVQVP
jgi:hypothetical protein